MFNWEVSQTLDRLLILRNPNLCCHSEIYKILEGLSRNFENFAMTKAQRDTVLFDDLPAAPNIVDRTVSVSLKFVDSRSRGKLQKLRAITRIVGFVAALAEVG